MLVRRKDWDEIGVSEVIGTILILGMTVTLFSAVLLWVYSIPTPTPDVKVDFVGTLEPIYKNGAWDGANITLRHNSGESLSYFTTSIFFTIQGSTGRRVDQLKLTGKLILPPDNNRPYGLIDGPDNTWNSGERWFYTNHSIKQDDRVEVMIIDTAKSVLLWQRVLYGIAGLNPPVFVEKWADKDASTSLREPPATNVQFTVYAKVIDPDNDLNMKSVYCQFAAFFGIPDYRANAYRMNDYGKNGDQVANDTIYTFTASWLKPVNMSWDGSVVIFNATDLQGHKTTARLTLTVVQGPSTGPGIKPPIKTGGAPPNLHYNGLQGFNLFNATEWDYKAYEANETRTFKEKETVVVVVASALLKNSRGSHNELYLYDPFSNVPPEPVVYGTNKVPTGDTQASNTMAFTFYDYVNGYNVFTFRFELNNVSSVGTNYYTNPTHPPYYWFAKYPLEITIWDDIYPSPSKFHTTDTINITDNSGNMRTYPKLETFKDSSFNTKSNRFNSTDMIWVRITMKTVDATYQLGNVVIQDFLGGTQIWKAPLSGKYVNQPICPVTAACSTGTLAVEKHDGTLSYRFSLNLSLTNQDPWVPGTQDYALRIMWVSDADEEYTLALQSQLTIHAPDFSLDIAIANDDTMDPRWGTHDLGYYYENINGWDRWNKLPIWSGPPDTNKWIMGIAIKYLDYDGDGDFDLVGSFKQDNNNAWIFLFRRDLDSSGNTIWTRFILENTGNDIITSIATGSIDGDTAPEIIVGSTSGKVWYYKNDGSWTKVNIDISRTAQVNSIDIGDFNGDHGMDVVVARNANAQKQVTWYPNLDGNGKFTTTQQTDWWKAEQETTVYGTRTNDYTYTLTDDTNREQLTEAVVNFPASYSNDTASSEASCATNKGAIFSGTYTDTATQNDVYEVLRETDNNQGQGKKEMQCTWTIVVPQGSTHKFRLDAYRTAAADGFRFYFSTTAGQLGTLMFSVTKESDDDSYQTYDLGTTTGTVYITVTDNGPTNNEAEDRVYVDHMYIETVIPAGDRSALEHKWKLTRLPNRPGSTYTMYVKGYRNDPGTEGDNFAFYYSTAGDSGPWAGPTITVNQGTEALYSYVLPAGIAGAEVWIKVVDTDRRVNYLQLADIYVNVLNITVQTPGGITGIDINLDDGANGMVLDAGNQDDDGNLVTPEFDDIAVGTANGNIYKCMGSAGGLIGPTGKHASPGGSISGIKLADAYLGTQNPGLEIVASTGASVYVYTGGGTSGILRKTLTTPSSESIKALAAGDVDADGDDDIVVTTGGTNIGRIVYWRNNWGDWVSPIVTSFLIGSPIWAVDLGDASNSAHRGR